MVSGAVSINGRLCSADQPLVSVYNRAFLYGEGVFETLRTYGRRPFAVAEHLARLARTARALQLPMDVPIALLESELNDVIDASPAGELVLRVHLSWSGFAPGLDHETEGEPCRVVLANPLPLRPVSASVQGVDAITYQATYWAPYQATYPVDSSAFHQVTSGGGGKTTSYVAHVQAARAARQAGANEALLVDERTGYLIDGATSHVVLIVDDQLLTPDASSVDGITRRHSFALASDLGYRVRRTTLRVDNVITADEAFLCSTLREILPLVRLDGRILGTGTPGKTTQRLRDAFHRHVGSPNSAKISLLSRLRGSLMPFFPSRPLSLVLFATSLVFSAAGCKTKCENIGGRTVCTAKSLSGYVGTTVPREVSWTPGQPIDIVVDGGNVRVGTVASLAVQVLPYEATKNPSPNQVYVEFTPVIAIPADEKEKGIQQMTTQLTLSATATAGGPVRVAVTPTGTTDSSLSASVRLYLPANFNGDLNVTNSAGGKTNGDLSVQGVTGAVRVLTSTGSITVNGVGSTIDAQTGVGDVTVVFGSPPVASATGKLVTELGNIALTLKQASNVSLQAQASSPDGLVLAPDPLPAGWQMAVSAPTAKSFTGNAGNAAPWFLDASQGVKSTVTFTLVP